MDTKLKLAWTAWLAASLATLAGAIGFEISSAAKKAPLPMELGAQARIELTLPLASKLNLSLEFDEDAASSRAHGSPSYRGDPLKDGALWHPDPGEPAKIKATIDGARFEALFEALPRTSASAGSISRQMVPFVDDGNPQIFPWPPSLPELPAGRHSLLLTVVDAGAGLSGSKASISVEPPLSFKSAMPGYGWLWWFFAWPAFAAALGAGAAALLWKTRQQAIGKSSTPSRRRQP